MSAAPSRFSPPPRARLLAASPRAASLGFAFAPLALALAPLALAACDEAKKDTPAQGRSEAVVATGSMPTAAPTPSAASAHEAPTVAAKRVLCEGQLDKPGRPFPKVTLAHAEAPGAMPLDGKIATGKGWTWINLCASWCGPCKEEIPRLRGWEKKVAAAGTPMQLVFVSIDDDERQLDQFLAAQPDSGVHAALWAKSGPIRDAFLGGLKIKDSPELPEHVLVDPSGKVRCVIEGAVDDGDYAQAAAIVAKK